MNTPNEELEFKALAGLVEAASAAKAIFPYLAANGTRLRRETEAFVELARAQGTKPYERLLVASLRQWLASGVQLDSLEQAKSHVSSLAVHDGQAPWIISMLQSLWHLRNDPSEPANAQPMEDRLAVLISIYNETRCCELALRSLRQYAGLPHHIIAVNNSSRDVSDFRNSVTRNGLVDEWIDTGVTHHGLGLQKAFGQARSSRYIALLDSDAIGLRKGWLAEFRQMLSNGTAMVGPLREPGSDTVTGQAVHACCMMLDQNAIGNAFQIDFRSFWPFWDVGGLLTWDCRAHGLPIATVPHVYENTGSTSSAIVNNSVKHLWYASRISDLDDEAVLDGHKVGTIRRRLEKDLCDPAIAALTASPRAGASVPEVPSTDPLLSVVLTTCNRPDLLRLVLDGLARQTMPTDKWEVVIVDDGSQTPTREIAREFADKIEISYIYQENSGLAAARNAGVALARGSIVLFQDDDDMPDENLVAEHIRSHQQHPDENIVVLGHLDWHPELTVTPLMHYITHEGGQYFGYDNMVDEKMYGAWKWWGGLVSVKTSLLRSVEGPFDSTFRFGHEDTELVCRLLSREVKVLYNASARKLLLRPVGFEDFCSRRVRQGRALFHMASKHGDLVVKRYGLDKVEEEYASHYKPNLQRWHDVLVGYEPAFNADPEPLIRGTDPSAAELKKYWALCFRGYMLKGYLEEASAASVASSAMKLPVTLNAQVTQARETVQMSPQTQGVQTILFICPTLPRPDVGSSNVRVHNILDILARQRRNVEVVYFGQNENDQSYTQSWGVRIAITHMTPRTSELMGYIEKLQPACVWITNLWNPSFCESMYKVADWLRKSLPSVPLVVDTMDHHAAKFRRQFEHSHRQTDEQTAAMFEAVEARLYPLAHKVITVTETEAQSIAATVPGCSFSVIPNIHAPGRNNPGYASRRNICFIGSLGIPHNADGVRWFINDVLPAIRSRLPGVEFHIMGHGNETHRQLFEAADGVKVIGYVPDAEEAVSHYRLFVCPLVYGAGMKGKLGTAASSGTPFVTTTVGAEGFGLINGTDCFVVDGAAEFAAGCMLLYSDEQLWTRFSEAAGRKFASAFSPAAVAPMLERLMAELMVGPEGTSQAASFAQKSTRRVATLLQNSSQTPIQGGTVDA
jgi:glycosyltransferase involved in cell wall biosynthesis